MLSTETSPAVFQFPDTGQQVRTVSIDEEPWFVAADVCAVLAIRNNRDALTQLENDEKGVATTDTPGGDQRVSVVNEPGLYSLILRSRKPEARAFKRWIVHEVLPALRRTGRYEVAPRQYTPREMALAVLKAEDEKDRALAEVAQTRAELEAAGDAIQAHDQYLSASGGDRLVRQVAQLLDTTETKLRAFLVDERFIYRRAEPCGTRQWVAYAHAAHLFKPVEKLVDHHPDDPDRPLCPHYTLHVRPAGVEAIRRRLARRAQVTDTNGV